MSSAASSLARFGAPFIFAIGLAACTSSSSSSGGGNPDVPGPYHPPIAAPNPSDSDGLKRGELEKKILRQLLNMAQATCEEGPNCPRFVGLVTTLERQAQEPGSQISYAPGLCSGTLVAPDLVLTNSHCVPVHVIKGEGCEGALGFRLITDMGQGLVATCKQVEYFSAIDHDTAGQPDYAFFRLDRPLSMEVAQISRGGFEDGKTYSAWVGNPLPGQNYGSEFSFRQCTAVRGSLLAPEFLDDKGAEIALAGSKCEIRRGNSGSGIFDQDGNVRGVISHSFLKEGMLKEFQEKKASPRLIEAIKKSERFMGRAANLACAEIKGLGPSPRSDCHEVKKTDDLLGSILQAQMNRISEKLPSYFSFAFDIRPPAFSFMEGEYSLPVLPRVHCVRRMPEWSPWATSNFKTQSESADSIMAQFSEYEIQISFSLDSYLRIVVAKPKIKKLTTMRLAIPRAIADMAKPTIELKEVLTASGETIQPSPGEIKTAAIPWCIPGTPVAMP